MEGGEEENKTNIQTSFITTLHTFKNLSWSILDKWKIFTACSERGRGQCVIIHMEINVDLLVIRAIWEVDSRLFATNGGVWLTPTRYICPGSHKSSPQCQYRWIISVPTSFSPSVSYAQLPDCGPSMNSFSVWWVCCPHTSLKTKTTECEFSTSRRAGYRVWLQTFSKVNCHGDHLKRV